MKVCKETFLPKCCYQMRIGYITCVIYNTPDNLRIALEDNLIENSAKNSDNHKLRINTVSIRFHPLKPPWSRGTEME